MNVLYRLLSNPEYIEPLRHDVETAIAEEGWSKAGIKNVELSDTMLEGFLKDDSLAAAGRLVKDLGLTEGKEVLVIIKASDVILAIND